MRQTRVAAVAVAVVAAVASAGGAQAVGEPRGELAQPRTAAPACGTVLLAGRSWLGGVGVDIHSNGATQGGSSCAGFTVANPAKQYGGGWQCVEVAARLYHVKGWGVVYAGGNGGARYIPEGSPGLAFHPNGSGYTPVAGDLVIEAFGTYGHVTVVDWVDGNGIHAVEQNAAISARKTYQFSGGVATGAYNRGAVRGFMHSPRNPAKGASAAGTASLANAVGQVVRRRLILRWQPSPGTAPTGFRVQLQRRDVRRGAWSGGVTLGANARRFQIRITRGKVYRLRVAALSREGRGPWRATGLLRS